MIIHEYKPSWPGEFEIIRESLLEILGPLAYRIDHIGSTSVPGLGAKDVIDIQITVAELTAEISRRLIDAGYRYWAAAAHDHVPVGEDESPVLWEKFFFYQPEGARRTNVHVRVAGSHNQRYALLFRDYLHAHPNAARTIELIKRQLVRYHPDDEDAYYDMKDPVYDLIWVAAQDWARETGWSSD
jgi:GrpB-like predicted nucleotidyltransferase (UPF0157 family)